MIFRFNQVFWRFVYAVGNLQFAISLLLLISFFSSIGTFIEQEKTIDFYEVNYPISSPIFGFINSDLIISFGLNHVYTTNWFLVLILLFGSSLLACTFSRQIPSLKMARVWKFLNKRKTNKTSGMTFSISEASLGHFSYLLRKSDFNIIQRGNSIYAYKGLVGKVGPILVHLSIIFVLIGSVIGFLFGFISQEIIPKGEIFHLQNVVSSGPLSFIRNDFEGYVRDFKIAYTDQGLVDQFYSDLEVLNYEMKPKLRKTIFVNEPLRYEDITFYQTDWGVLNIEVGVNNSKVMTIPLSQISLNGNSRFWVSSIGKSKNLLFVLQDLTGKYMIYSPDKVLVASGEIGHKIFIEGDELRILKIVPETGIQVKSDPGVALVYFGFFCLIFSVVFSYTSYAQIWAVRQGNQVWIYGTTNRAIYFFEKRILDILSTMKFEVEKFI